MTLKELLAQEQKRYSIIVNNVQKQLENVPEGTLRIGKSNGCIQYLHNLPGESSKLRYIPKKEIALASSLAQKTYNEKVFRLANKRLSQINRMLADYENNEIESIYLNEHPERQKLITPVEQTYAKRLNIWKEKPYVGKPFKEDSPIILTNNELRVRSKSEKIMADYFDSLGIVYKYECPLYLQPYGIIYPDFTFLSPHTGKEIYWEHEGMLDKEDYARNAVKKINLYESNNIYPGEQLILTFETSTSVINTNQLKRLTQKYLL